MKLSEFYKQFKNSKQEGEFKQSFSVKQVWVKKLILVKDWNEYYSQNSSYCFLREIGKRYVEVGFLVANKISFGCEELTEIEKIRVQEYRKDNEIFPLPFEVKKEQSVENSPLDTKK